MSFDRLPKKLKIGLIAILVANILLFIASIVMIILFAIGNNTSNDCESPVSSLYIPEKIVLTDGRSSYNAKSKSFELQHARDKTTILKGKLGLKVDNDYLKNISIKINNNGLDIRFISSMPSYLVSNTTLKITTDNIKASNYDINCERHDWSYDVRLEDKNQEFEDCFELNGAYWYGGAESYLEQFWPINNVSHDPHRPFLTGLFGISSSVLERYWLSSNGVAIIVNQSIPLFVKMNKTNICFLASSTYPYSNKQIMKLVYDVCTINHEPNHDTFLKDLHLEMIKRYFAIPIGIHDTLMFKRQIWSTWATFKREINESVVIDFAKDILANNYTHSQLEIDDKWQTAYGDFEFDKKKFPNATRMIHELNDLGFRTTVWEHPFANVDSATFLEKAFEFFWARAPDALHPAFTAWLANIDYIQYIIKHFLFC